MEPTTEVKPVIGFGIGQLNNPTPKWMTMVMRIFQLISGLWALLPQDLLINLSDHEYATVNRWIIVMNTFLLYIIKFFGWDVKPVVNALILLLFCLAISY